MTSDGNRYGIMLLLWVFEFILQNICEWRDERGFERWSFLNSTICRTDHNFSIIYSKLQLRLREKRNFFQFSDSLHITWRIVNYIQSTLLTFFLTSTLFRTFRFFPDEMRVWRFLLNSFIHGILCVIKDVVEALNEKRIMSLIPSSAAEFETITQYIPCFCSLLCEGFEIS